MPKIEEEPVSAERQKTTGEGRDYQESKTQTGEDKQWRRNQGCRSLIKDWDGSRWLSFDKGLVNESHAAFAHREREGVMTSDSYINEILNLQSYLVAAITTCLMKDCIVMGLFGKTVLKTNCETFFPAMTRIVGTLVYNSLHTLHVYIVARSDFSWGDAQFHQETLGNLKVAMKSTNKLCANSFKDLKFLFTLLMGLIFSHLFCSLSLLSSADSLNCNHLFCKQKFLCNLITCRIWFGQPLMPYRWNKLRWTPNTRGDVGRVVTISVVDFINKVKYKTNPTDLCKISIYGSMLWTLLNLTSNFSAFSIIYPTSLCMELLHLNHINSLKTIFIFLCKLLNLHMCHSEGCERVRVLCSRV
ncbi:hypothetical protein DVH24_010552 [Malus domestica]|uniref:Uncharacterized protein n=1 Tax=Malus domestica TaxID=3750 RepID=A0A498JTG2_MALDO|nr:hypothetical protein DVH24_010552 [Malus domestica]